MQALEKRCDMQYIEMTIDEANEYCKENNCPTVLVAVQNLEKEEIPLFVRRNKLACEKILEDAETIARVYDDFVNQLRVFTEKQVDIRYIEPHGILSTILLKE